MRLLRFSFLILFFSGFCLAGIGKVSLVLDPPTVRRNEHATLRCLYDLGEYQLNSVKFYRGRLEFYRYAPSDLPEKKSFTFPGINVDVSIILL